MYCLDFEYDGHRLSEYGFIICDFSAPTGANTVNAGAKITFNTVSKNSGKNYSLLSTKYDECIQIVFDICKNPDVYGNRLTISYKEFREIMRWLNRREFLRMQFLMEDGLEYETCYFDASFNVEKIEINSRLCGMRVTMFTNAPFGYAPTKTEVLSKGTNSISAQGDEIGYLYPDLVISLNESGDLHISNETYGGEMVIKNCIAGEVISVYGDTRIVSSTNAGHAIYNDFNFEYLKLGNDYLSRENVISVSLNCDMQMRYKPLIKVTP